MDKNSYKINRLLSDASFRRWIEGTADREEAKKWDDWVSREPGRRKLVEIANRRIAGFSFRPHVGTDVDKNWQKLHKRIREPKTKSPKPSFQSRTSPGTSGLIYRYAAVAVVMLLVAAGVAGMYRFAAVEETQTLRVATTDVTTAFGERKTIRFSDGTEIVLNANSSLRVMSASGSAGEVMVRLQGEALFRVTPRKRADLPFTVLTPDGKVSVLGTEFVVSYYDNDDGTSVVLTEGSVEVQLLPESEQQPTTVVMEPGQKASFTRFGDSVKIAEVNTSVYTSWSTHTLEFDWTPLPQVARRLEHTHGVEIEMLDPALKERRLSGSIENTSLEAIIKAIAQSLSIEYSIRGQQVFLESANS